MHPKDDNKPQTYDSDEDDDDYVPPEKDDSETSGGEEDSTVPVVVKTQEDEESKKRAREALWADFQASVAATPSNSSAHVAAKEKLVKVEKRYLFAGKEVIEVVEVPEGSADAKKWPAWKDLTTVPAEETSAALQPDTAVSESANTITTQTQIPTDEKSGDPSDTRASTDTAVTSSSTDNFVPPLKPPLRKPGPRKSKVTLAPLPGPSKAKKLTTLDKSAMDWRNHMQAEQEAGSSVVDELEANRRGGGYLEKVDFLKRVEERREDNLDAMKSSKRRKL